MDISQHLESWKDPAKRPSVSVVIVSWNTLPWLKLYVEGRREDGSETYGLRDCTGVDYEIIIVDQGSSDGSAKACRLMARGYGDVKAILLKENTSYSHALNLGLAMAKGDVLISSNPDIEVVRPSMLELTAERVTRWGPSTIVGPKTREKEGIHYLQGHYVAFHRRFLEEVGYWNENFIPVFWEDVELSWRAAQMGWGIIEDQAIPMFHHVGRSTVYGNNPDYEKTEFDIFSAANKRLLDEIVATGKPRRYIPEWISPS